MDPICQNQGTKTRLSAQVSFLPIAAGHVETCVPFGSLKVCVALYHIEKNSVKDQHKPEQRTHIFKYTCTLLTAPLTAFITPFITVCAPLNWRFPIILLLSKSEIRNPGPLWCIGRMIKTLKMIPGFIGIYVPSVAVLYSTPAG